MKKKSLLFITLAGLLAFVLVFNSCRKDKEDESADTSAAGDNAIAENIFKDVFDQVKDAGKTSEDSISKKSTMGDGTITIFVSPCLTLTVVYDTVDIWPIDLTIDFGDSNCVQNPTYDGRARRGKFSAHFTGPYRDSASVITVNNFVDYYVDDHKVEGTKTVTNEGHNDDGNLWYSVDVINAVITKPNNGGQISWNQNSEREWIGGEPTILWPWDDEYLITGTQNGTSANGKSYTINTTSPLNVIVSCRWIRSGTLNLDIQDLPTIAINYGDGTCDANAVATVNGVDYPFVMQ